MASTLSFVSCHSCEGHVALPPHRHEPRRKKGDGGGKGEGGEGEGGWEDVLDQIVMCRMEPGTLRIVVMDKSGGRRIEPAAERRVEKAGDGVLFF